MVFQSTTYAFNREEWLETLKSAFNPTSIAHEGHKYIYLNSDRECRTFSASSEAHQQGFNQKITIDNIIAISQEYFADYKLCKEEETDILCHAFEVMDKGAQQSWWSRLIHFLRGLGFQNTHELIQRELLQVMDRKIQFQDDAIERNVKTIQACLSQPENNDKRVEKAQHTFLEKIQAHSKHTTPKSYHDRKKRERELTLLVLESTQMAHFSENIVNILKKDRQLTDLLQLYEKLDPKSPIEESKLQKMTVSLDSLIEKRFDKFLVHDEDKCRQDLAQLTEDFIESISLMSVAYQSLPNHQKDRLQKILYPKATSTFKSPLRNFIINRQRPEGKAEFNPEQDED